MPKPKRKNELQDPPFCVQVELVEGCNLRCTFCGLNGIRGKENNFKFMTVKTAVKVSKQLEIHKWNSRLEFAMHGEPTLNSHIVPIVRTFRRARPNASMMITTNGAGFLKDVGLIDELLRYANVIAMDDYANVNIVDRVLSRYSGNHRVEYYPDNKDANPHTRRGKSERLLVVVRDISEETKGTHSTLNNHAGAGAPPNRKADGKRCAKPFREMSIRWDGSVAVCCNDWRGYYGCGNLLDQDLGDIWNGPEFRAARRKLYHGQRDFGPCNGCDALSYRPGLLPDHKGQLELVEPTAEDLNTIETVLARKPYTKPVLRTWELEKAPQGFKKIQKKTP